TLKYFEEILNSFGFIRIHRSYVINPEFVIRYSKGKGGYVTMKNEKELEVSSNKKKEFLDAFNK
ncbi:MAG TPA: LytTR family DNA-binding domain-containing protein, partial [Chryseosolibacter sp.]